jgi:hypothetical protein
MLKHRQVGRTQVVEALLPQPPVHVPDDELEGVAVPFTTLSGNQLTGFAVVVRAPGGTGDSAIS